ncbi:MAG TPA: NAD-dependent deacylase [Phycisphaerales bacterium]|nr:NAD-dependent deacylase [Phycisphaerales bacterium]
MPIAPLDAARRALANANRVVAITGAGVSAESGIPTFRGGQTGGMEALWKSFDPMTLATPEAFARDPKTVTQWYDWRRQRCREAIPNPAHLALADLERLLYEPSAHAEGVSSSPRRFTLLTQNVDRLHQRAGSTNIAELHGNIVHWRCSATDQPADIPEGPFPSCPMPSPHAPGAFLRPGVVWFGEALPEAALRTAFEAVHAMAEGDIFLSIGTSALVYPAAGFIELAQARGATTIEVNRDPTPLSGRVDFSLMGRAGEVLPALVAVNGRTTL